MDIKTQKMLADVVLNAQNKTVKPYTTTATVKSVNNGIVYVEIPGSDRDTPVKNSSVSVKKGDVVDLVVSHDDTHITGNRSDVAVPESTAQKMSQTLEATRLEMDNELDLFNNKIKMVNNRIEMQDNKIEMQNNTITQFGNTIDQQNNIIEQQNNNITEIGNTVNSQNNTITEIGNKVNSQGNTITEIGNTVNSQKNTITEISNTVNTQGNKITEIGNTVNTQGNKITEIGNTVNSQGNDITEIGNKVNSQGNTITEIGNTIELQDSSIKTLDSTVQTLDSTVKTQGSNIETLGSNVEIINSAFVIQDGKLTGISEIVTNILKSGYVTTDLLNADVAWIENGKIKEGAIGTTEIADASITTAKIDELSADVIKTGTIRTERLILTTDEVDPKTGEKKVALITALNAKANAGEGNILDGAVIADETITAAKIDVVDLNAFNATIGNFHIGTSSMYNGKTSLKDPTNGVYIGTDGIALGQGSLLGMTDDSPFRVESDGDFHLGAKDGNYINFNAFTGALDINVSSLKIESSNVVDRLNNIDENAIVSQIVEYYPSTSPTSLTGGSWSTGQPTWDEGIYIWSRTKNTNGKGDSSYTTPVCITGNTGAKGDKGDKGDTGATTYFHIKYSSVSNPTSSSQMTETPSTYIGTYVDFTQTDSSDPSKYTWSRFQGAQGEKGDQGIAGTNGSNGKTSYLHIAYANSSDGTTGFSVSDSTNKLYIGQYTDFTSSDSTDPTKYSWTKIKGDKGNTGATGVGVKSSDVTYQSSTSGTTVPTGTWSTSVPSVSAGSYLWTKTVITYTNNTTTTSYSVGKMGANGTNGTNGTNGKDGADGSDGRGIKSTAVTYQAWSNGTSTPTGTWESSPPLTTADKPYLWSKTVLTYTDNTTSTTYSVGSTPEGIVVGGRNLLLNSADLTKWTPESGTTVKADTDGYFKISTTNNSSWWSTEQDITLDAGSYTVSGYFKAGSKKGIFIIRRFDNYVEIFKKIDVLGYFKHSFTISETTKVRVHIGLRPTASGDYVYAKLFKLEKGNKATDWTPAPEDTEASITEVKTIAEQTADKFSWLVKSGTSATNFELTDRTANLVANYININGLVTFSGLGSDAQNGIINSIEVGGRNLLLGSANPVNKFGWNSKNGSATITEETMLGVKGILLDVTAASSVGQQFCHYEFGASRMELIKPNSYYTLSFDVYPNVDDLIYFKIMDPNASNAISGYSEDKKIVANKWNHISLTVETFATITISDQVIYISGINSVATYKICNFKLEEGNKATDWTPAPEDTEAEIQSVKTIADNANKTIADWCYNNDKTYINGGKIYTGSITAKQINVKDLFSKNITATNMTISGDSKFGNFRANTEIEGLAYENSNYGGVMYLGKIAALIDEDEYGFQLGNGNSMTNIQPGGVFVQSNCGGSYPRKTTIHGGFIETYCISTSQSGGTVSIGSDIVPLYSDEGTLLDITLGSSSKKFADLYTSKFNGTSVNSDGIASTSGYGVTKLSSSYTSSSTSIAANSNAVYSLYNKMKTIVARDVATSIFSSCTYDNNRLRCAKINAIYYSMTMFGGVIEVTNGSTAISYQWVPFFQIPEGFRPSTTMHTVVHVFDKDTSRLSVSYAVEIHTDGIVYILGSFVASESFRFVFPCIMYI